MGDKKLSLRKCVACNQMKEKSLLFRLVRINGEVDLDLSRKANGRGAWICQDVSCIDIAAKRKSFNRSLKCPVKDEVINKLYLELENGSR